VNPPERGAVRGSAESSSSGAMSLGSKRRNGPGGGCHRHHQGRRSACVGSGRVPPSRRAASIPFLVCQTLRPAVPLSRDRTRMSELTRVPSLIGDMYEAILDRSVWNGVFRNLTQFVGAQAGALVWKNCSRSTDIVQACGIKSPSLEVYKERYAKLDPTTSP